MLDNSPTRVFQTLNLAQARLARRVEVALLGTSQLSLKEVQALDELGRRGPLRLKQLAEVLDLSASGLSRLADRLEAGGLVERRRCGSDHRGSLAGLTAAGRARRGQALAEREQALQQLLGGLCESEVTRLTESLDGLTAALQS